MAIQNKRENMDRNQRELQKIQDPRETNNKKKKKEKTTNNKKTKIKDRWDTRRYISI